MSLGIILGWFFLIFLVGLTTYALLKKQESDQRLASIRVEMEDQYSKHQAESDKAHLEMTKQTFLKKREFDQRFATMRQEMIDQYSNHRIESEKNRTELTKQSSLEKEELEKRLGLLRQQIIDQYSRPQAESKSRRTEMEEQETRHQTESEKLRRELTKQLFPEKEEFEKRLSLIRQEMIDQYSRHLAESERLRTQMEEQETSHRTESEKLRREISNLEEFAHIPNIIDTTMLNDLHSNATLKEADSTAEQAINATTRKAAQITKSASMKAEEMVDAAKLESDKIKSNPKKAANAKTEVVIRLSDTIPLAETRRVQADDLLPLWSPPRRVENPSDTAVLAWHGKGETISVGSYTLTDSLVYICDGRKSSDEASCIDRRHTIGKPVAEPVGSLGYYPEYSRLSRDQKANYLQWLAEGRSGPLSDIGYAFLYFYGLERRLLVDNQDLSPIVKEVVRLLETYTFSGSFDGYLSRFLSYTLARTGIGTLKEKWFQAVFERTRAQRDEQLLSVGLAWLFSHQRPLPAEWARRIARLDPRSPRSVVLDRLPDQFNALFLTRYSERYGDGMTLAAAKRDREIVYQPASPSLLKYASSSIELNAANVPHVMGIQSQFAPLVQIWTRCVEELKPLSRVMAKGADVSNRAAYEALPDELKAETEHPDKPRWDQLAVDQVQEDGTVILEVRTLAEIQGYAEKPKLTAKQSESIAQTAHSVGFAIEPDPRITNRAYAWEDHVVLFRPEDRPSLPADTHFAGASLLLELGMFIAAADGQVEEEEVNHIATFLESQFLLDPPDARRLEALKRVFLRQHPSIVGIGRRLKTILDTEQVESIGHFLFGVAAANGAIEKPEITALRSAYRSLGIDPKSLDRQLAEYDRIAKEPVEVIATSEHGGRGEVIPSPKISGPGGKIILDPLLIKILIKVSARVSDIIDVAMGDDPAEDYLESEPKPPPQPQHTDPRFKGLDQRYSAVLLLLCERNSWTRPEFEALIRQHSLMVSGTLDKINDWAYDRFPDPILEEEGDAITVHTRLLVEQS